MAESTVYDNHGELIKARYEIVLWKGDKVIKKIRKTFTNGYKKREWISTKLIGTCRNLEYSLFDDMQEYRNSKDVFTEWKAL